MNDSLLRLCALVELRFRHVGSDGGVVFDPHGPGTATGTVVGAYVYDINRGRIDFWGRQPNSVAGAVGYLVMVDGSPLFHVPAGVAWMRRLFE